jgi:putative DNA primase/helicase
MNGGRTGEGGERWTTLPPELRELTRYLPWRAVPRANGGTGKCPLQLRGRSLYPAQAASPASWLSLKDALYWVQVGKADGVGICLPPGMICLDLDNVLTGGELQPWAAELVDRADSFTQASPSGKGIHILGYHPAERLPGRLTDMKDVEVLTAGRYLTVTGEALHCRPLRDLTHVVPVSAHAQVSSIGRAQRQVESSALLDRIARGRSGDLFERLYVRADLSGYPSQSEADLALC